MSEQSSSHGASGSNGVLRASFQFWRVYMICVGLLLMVVPNSLLGLLGFPPIEDNWIRALGALVFNVGLIYFPMLREPLHKGFVEWTIYGRYCFASLTVVFFLLGWMPWNFMIFGAIDATNATWTWIGLKRAKL